MKTLRDELRVKMPGLAGRAPRQPKAAIRLFCYECMGGSMADAASCELRDCFLWPHGPAGRAERRAADPTCRAGAGDLSERSTVEPGADGESGQEPSAA